MSDSKLNEAVARKMGLVKKDNCWAEPGQHCPCHDSIQLICRCYLEGLKNYAGSIEAAGEIVESVDNRFILERPLMGGKTWHCGFGSISNGDYAGAEADTAPRAICLAFLKLNAPR